MLICMRSAHAFQGLEVINIILNNNLWVVFTFERWKSYQLLCIWLLTYGVPYEIAAIYWGPHGGMTIWESWWLKIHKGNMRYEDDKIILVLRLTLQSLMAILVAIFLRNPIVWLMYGICKFWACLINSSGPGEHKKIWLFKGKPK